MERVISVIEIPGDKRVNIGIFHLTCETDSLWNIVKNRLLGPDLTSNRFPEELTTTLQIVKWELKKCTCCGSPEHLIAACSWQLKAVHKSPHFQGPQLYERLMCWARRKLSPLVQQLLKRSFNFAAILSIDWFSYHSFIYIHTIYHASEPWE